MWHVAETVPRRQFMALKEAAMYQSNDISFQIKKQEETQAKLKVNIRNK